MMSWIRAGDYHDAREHSLQLFGHQATIAISWLCPNGMKSTVLNDRCTSTNMHGEKRRRVYAFQ